MCDCVYHLSVRSEQSSYTLDSLVPKALPHTNQIKFELQVMKQGYDLDITSILKPRDSTKTWLWKDASSNNNEINIKSKLPLRCSATLLQSYHVSMMTTNKMSQLT